MESYSLTITKLKPFNDGKLLKGMFEYQINLINKYISLGKLPSLELDLSTKESQNFLRHTINNILEELGESYNEQVQAYQIFSTQVYTSGETLAQIKMPLTRLQEEIADILHFFIELLIYSKIEADDINAYYKQILVPQGLDVLMFEEGLLTTFAAVRNSIIVDDEHRVAVFESYKFPFKEKIAGMNQGYNLMQQIGKVNWQITYSLLYKAQNNLKEKNWRGLAENKSNIQAYQEGLMEAWTWLFILFDLYRMDEVLLYTAYEDKNVINQQRLIDNQ